MFLMAGQETISVVHLIREIMTIMIIIADAQTIEDIKLYTHLE